MATLTRMVEQMRGEPAPAVPYDMRKQTRNDARDGPRDAGRGGRPSRPSWATRATTSSSGATTSRGRRDQREAHEQRLQRGQGPSGRGAGDGRRRGGVRGRRPRLRRPSRPEPAEHRRGLRRPRPARRRGRVPHEGHRGRHAPEDERGARRGVGTRGRIGSPWCRAPTSRARSRFGSPRRPSSPRPPPRPQPASRTPSRPRTSARTRTPTSSASNCAAPTRTSSR